MQDNRIVNAFAELRTAGKKTLLPFLTAGYPDLKTTALLLGDLEKRGVRICELGIPFSDPIADGPTIQASYTVTLETGMTVKDIFEMVRKYRVSTTRDGSTKLTAGRKGAETSTNGLALLAMVSYSIVFRCGAEAFCTEAAEVGFDGLIVPDLPIDEAAKFGPMAAAHGLCNVMLIAPTTPLQRRLEIAKASTGFVYYISVSGITGERDKMPPETIKAVAELRKHVETPICIGFGVSSPDIVAEVCRAADGAIVGSAIIHRITDAMKDNLPREELVEKVGSFISELLEPIS